MRSRRVQPPMRSNAVVGEGRAVIDGLLDAIALEPWHVGQQPVKAGAFEHDPDGGA